MSAKQWGHGYSIGSLKGKYEGTIEEIKNSMSVKLTTIRYQIKDIFKIAFQMIANEEYGDDEFQPDMYFDSLMAAANSLYKEFLHEKKEYERAIKNQQERLSIVIGK